MIETPYLLFLGDAPDMLAAKVAIGIRDWRPDNAVGQLRLEGCAADSGLPDMTLAEAKAAGANTLVIGVANRGGVISKEWKKVLVTALEEGFDLAAGQAFAATRHTNRSHVSAAISLRTHLHRRWRPCSTAARWRRPATQTWR